MSMVVCCVMNAAILVDLWTCVDNIYVLCACMMCLYKPNKRQTKLRNGSVSWCHYTASERVREMRDSYSRVFCDERTWPPRFEVSIIDARKKKK